uniref:Peptidase M20 dimerisation domain-containing protein n=1 Tax=Palpitomonas bilix TaxID=652834 RepID=A0A7S3D2A4_9EUKA|mmetsp:Transcript_18465/g.46453  ORF Transcript_18465/g.46453 Transcript_18465/m.46453 type:complete len:347 (+) Transcript_18465:57-1097(+)
MVNLGLSLNRDRFLNLLGKMVAEGENLQNQPPQFVAKEDLAGRHVLAVLKPYLRENGGVLDLKYVAYAEGRGNMIIQYKGENEECPTIAFVGSHMDVVVADKNTWKRDPFKMEIDGDIIHGRGTTDCLGHVALLADLFVQLAEKKPKLNCTVAGVIIVDEEAGGSRDEADVGVGRLMKEGELSFLRRGPVIWLDCADKQPNIGSGGTVQWALNVKGKLFHSGFPHKGINAVELAMEISSALQRHFYEKFPPHEKEKEYGFECSSSFKPTQISTGEGSVNQIPSSVTVRGDIRLIPFYDIEEAMKEIEAKLDEIKEGRFSSLPTRGPDSRFSIEDGRRLFVHVDLVA